MANTKYVELASLFFDKIKDYNLASLDEQLATDIAIGYIDSACSQFQSCSQSLNRDDVMQEFEEELSATNKQMLVNYMVIEYIDCNFLRTTSALKNRLSSSDFRSLNLPQHLAKIMELRSMFKSENDQLAINTSYSESQLFDIVTRKKR